MPTIKDIAKAADVSIATVSIVLNGKGKERKISGETQKRILEIAHKMNYVPNQSAKKLRVTGGDSYSRLLLGYGLPYQLSGPYYTRLATRNHEVRQADPFNSCSVQGR